MTKTNILPTLIATLIGIAGVLLLLFAWHLPPFAPAEPTTENAYVRGKVTTVAPQLSGYVASVEVTDFQTVAAGDVIARLDDRIYRQKLAQAEAALEAARAALAVSRQNVQSAEAVRRADESALAAARSGLTTAQSDDARTRALQSRGVATQAAAEQSGLALQTAASAVGQAQAALDVQRENINSATTQISTATANIASAEAAVQLARIDLDNTVIRAPADGRLGQVAVRVGQYVTAGTALVSHVGKDVWIIANFNETGLHGMKLGQPVTFTVDALDDQTFTGRVESYSPATASEFSLLSATNATGNFTKIAQRLPVRISIDPGQERSQYLSPGLSVVVHVNT
ncbi:HlyD family secretion protein [Paracoccus pacificus]|uniref:HlyD family secretion protein n=1 Tax=Paracoccus pacificus TaxID=1463598 RepID=A0ABW4R569_9RHOB